MFDVGKDAAPVSSVEGFIHDAASLNVNLIAGEDFVIDQSKELEKAALVQDIRLDAVTLMLGEQTWIVEAFIPLPPLLRLVLRHGLKYFLF